MGNWYLRLITARWGNQRAFEDADDQLRPSYNPYGKQKSPNDLHPPMNDLGDNGKGMGDTRDFIEQYDDMTHESLLDQYDEGLADQAHDTNTPPLDTIMDTPQSNGDSLYGDQMHPLGENQQTLRKAKEPYLDNKPNRLPGGGNFTPIKPLFRNRRSSVVSPLKDAWAWQTKKGRGQ
jgi:hypothetical protein